MQPNSGETVHNEKADAYASGGGGVATPHSRSIAAGREFVRALMSDLAAALVGVRQRFMDLLSRTGRYLDGVPLSPGQHRSPGQTPVPKSPENSSGMSFAHAGAVVLRRFAIGIVVVAVGVLALSGSVLWALHDLRLERPANESSRPALLLEASNGEGVGRVGPLKLAKVDSKDFPEHLIKAVLSIEDRRFYSHLGIDLAGIARAARRNMASGGIVEGGSTITQQVVRMRFLDNERSFTRKVREALTALWLERQLSKEEILTDYLNNIYLGAGAHGIPAAAHLYFSKRISELTLSESAMLAGLIKAPSQFNPLRDLQMARARAAIVLDAMVANGAIDEKAAATAKRQEATLKLAPEFSQAASWFADWVGREAAHVTGSFTRSIRARTTLDLRLQQLAEKVVNDVLARQGARAGVSQAALVALRPDGAVLAMVGGRDYRNNQFNRAIEANRHPGSAFKLFVYLAALRKGYSPNDVIDAGPLNIKGWQPENFGGRQYGRVTLAEAFARSINTAAVRLAMDVGLNDVVSAARDLGIHARLSPVPSLALGAAEVSLLDLTGAFASVRAGRRVEPWGIAAFGPDDDTRLLRSMGPPIIGSGQSLQRYQQPMTDLLRLVVERGTGRAAALDGFAAGKTGTSQNHRDAWFIGFNEKLVVGVWLGNDDGTPMKGVVGGALPASIWKRFMTEATPLVSRDSPHVADVPGQTASQAFAMDQASAAQEQALLKEAQTNPQTSLCDPQACAGAYRSFRASDCTYQSYGGERKVCQMGARPSISQPSTEASSQPQTGRSTHQPESGSAIGTDRDARATAQCNIDACGRKYRSFNSSDCTYQPFDGGRRRTCEIGPQSATTQQQRDLLAIGQRARASGRSRSGRFEQIDSEPTEGRPQGSRGWPFGRPEPMPRAPVDDGVRLFGTPD
jgi:penicillin-binding protein 1A